MPDIDHLTAAEVIDHLGLAVTEDLLGLGPLGVGRVAGDREHAGCE